MACDFPTYFAGFSFTFWKFNNTYYANHSCRLPPYLFHSLLIADSVDSHEASMLFSVHGAQILKRHYGIAAQPVMGSAAYHLGLQAKVLAFGDYQAGQLQSSDSQHHWWIEADGYLIGFMVSLFPVLVKRAGKEARIDPWMMQKLMAKAKKINGCT